MVNLNDELQASRVTSDHTHNFLFENFFTQYFDQGESRYDFGCVTREGYLRTFAVITYQFFLV